MFDKLRVLFAIGSMGGGGAERQVIHYLRHLDRQRFVPLLYLLEGRGELLSEVPADVAMFAFDRRQTSPDGYFPGRIRRRQIADLAQVLREQAADVMCAVTFHMTLIASGARRRRSTPWLAVEMADPRRDFPGQVTRFRWLKRRLLARAYRAADRCVAVSHGVRDGLQQYHGVPGERIAVLPNFIDVAEVDRLAQTPPPDWPNAAFHVVSVGRLHPQKGQRFLLEAVARLVAQGGRQRLRVHLLGQGPLEMELRRFVRDHRLESHVEFAGFQDNPIAWIKRADLFCLPSLYEGLPLALLEAMACGVPVLATDCPSGPREVLDGGRYGRLVPPGEVDALAAAIADAMDQPQAWQTLTPAARQRVEMEYGILTGIARLENLLREAAEAKRP
jgi:glycosyltransferase involved in cell wall biosynthesis